MTSKMNRDFYIAGIYRIILKAFSLEKNEISSIYIVILS